MHSIEQPDDWVLDPAAAAMLGAELACRHSVLPLGFDERHNTLHLAMTRPDDMLRREALQAAIAGKARLQWHVAKEHVVSEGLSRCYGEAAAKPWLVVLDSQEREQIDVAVIRLVDDLIRRAVEEGASDLHLTPIGEGLIARIRVDGIMRDLTRLSAAREMVVNRLKVMSSLDVGECRRPQDGRLQRLVAARWITLRISTFPMLQGESVVLRIHDRERKPASLAALGLDEATLAGVQAVLDAPPGLIVISGPTGSGKTTTLYAMLQALNDGSRHLITLEDPVEHEVAGVSQASVDESRALDFASGIKALLRHDPDVLMVGEIRDGASCRMAIRAALSGLRVLASVHADHSMGVVGRLLELGADRNELADTLAAALSQRLLRRSDGTGRLAVLEVFSFLPTARAAVKRSAPAAEVTRGGLLHGLTLAQSAAALLAAGRVEAKEVQRVFGTEIVPHHQEEQGCALSDPIS